MDDAAFARGTPEVELDRRYGMPVYIQGEKTDMASHAHERPHDLRGDRMQN